MPPVTSWMILKQSRAKEAAWLFVQWATSKENLLQILIPGSASPIMAGIRTASPSTCRPWSPSARCATPSGLAIQASILGQDVRAAAKRGALEMKKLMDATE